MGPAQSNRALWVVFSRPGRCRLHPPVFAAAPGTTRDVRPDHRAPIDACRSGGSCTVSDRDLVGTGCRRLRPFLLAAYIALAVSTILLLGARNLIWLGFLVVVFAENGLCRPAATASRARPLLSSALPVGWHGARSTSFLETCWHNRHVRRWRSACSAVRRGLDSLAAGRHSGSSCRIRVVPSRARRRPIAPLTTSAHTPTALVESVGAEGTQSTGQRDRVLWIFVAAMVLFHIGNAPGGVYLGLFARRELHASERFLSYLFVISMIAWMLTVWPTGKLAESHRQEATSGRCLVRHDPPSYTRRDSPSPLADSDNPGTRRYGPGNVHRRSGCMRTDRFDHPTHWEAQVLVGSALVAGSASGPTVAGLVLGALGYRGMFLLLSAIGLISTGIVVALVPESLKHEPRAASFRNLSRPLIEGP